jgi:hypothetical protein
VERIALGGRVFDILGEVFAEESLKDLLIRAIGTTTIRRSRRVAEEGRARSAAHLESIIKRNALCEVMDEKRLFAVKEEMERAGAQAATVLHPLVL